MEGRRVARALRLPRRVKQGLENLLLSLLGVALVQNAFEQRRHDHAGRKTNQREQHRVDVGEMEAGNGNRHGGGGANVGRTSIHRGLTLGLNFRLGTGLSMGLEHSGGVGGRGCQLIGNRVCGSSSSDGGRGLEVAQILGRHGSSLTETEQVERVQRLDLLLGNLGEARVTVNAAPAGGTHALGIDAHTVITAINVTATHLVDSERGTGGGGGGSGADGSSQGLAVEQQTAGAGITSDALALAANAHTVLTAVLGAGGQGRSNQGDLRGAVGTSPAIHTHAVAAIAETVRAAACTAIASNLQRAILTSESSIAVATAEVANTTVGAVVRARERNGTLALGTSPSRQAVALTEQALTLLAAALRALIRRKIGNLNGAIRTIVAVLTHALTIDAQAVDRALGALSTTVLGTEEGGGGGRSLTATHTP